MTVASSSSLIAPEPVEPSGNDFVMYVDESGTHGLEKIDAEFPVLTIAGVIFDADSYSRIAANVKRFKTDVLRRPNACIHSSDIRKWRKDYSHLRDEAIRDAALNSISELIARGEFVALSVTIRKDLLASSYYNPKPPYDLAVDYLLERFYHFLQNRRMNGENTAKGSVVFEARGKREDRHLSKVHEDKLDTGFAYATSAQMRYRINRPARFLTKRPPSAGLEIADLIAYPIARYAINPSAQNKAFEVVRPKLYAPDGAMFSYGLKIFPGKNKETPTEVSASSSIRETPGSQHNYT